MFYIKKLNTMKKIVFVLLTVIASSTIADAQFLRYGIKGGINSSKIKVDKTFLEDIVTPDGTRDFLLEQGDSKLGLHIGVFGRVQVLSLFIQPELLFTQTNGEFVITDQTDAQNTLNYLVEQKFSKFDIPVMIGWKFGPAKLFLGPVASFVISEKSDFKEVLNVNAAENEFKKAVFGYQAGVGIDIFKFATFDVKYEGNLSRLGENVTIGGKDFNLDQRNPQIIFSLGIFL